MNLLPIFEPIRDDLAAVEERILATVRATHEPLSSALEAILTSGGKRLRPALVVLAARLHRWHPEPVIDLAAAVEMLHTATLIHDDTIDGARLRRGRDTLNASWSRGAAVLAGDYLFARAAALAVRTENTRVASLFADTLATICDGELRQMLSLFDWRGAREGYYRRIYSKTASLFAASCEAGALLGQAPAEQAQALRAYGENLGMAFQLVDDVLDFVGNEKHLGKPVGSDLRQGIATLPVYHYLQSGGSRSLVETVLGDGAGEQAVHDLVVAVTTSPAIELCREEARSFAGRAVSAIAGLGDGPYQRALRELAEFVVEREL